MVGRRVSRDKQPHVRACDYGLQIARCESRIPSGPFSSRRMGRFRQIDSSGETDAHAISQAASTVLCALGTSNDANRMRADAEHTSGSLTPKETGGAQHVVHLSGRGGKRPALGASLDPICKHGLLCDRSGMFRLYCLQQALHHKPMHCFPSTVTLSMVVEMKSSVLLRFHYLQQASRMMTMRLGAWPLCDICKPQRKPTTLMAIYWSWSRSIANGFLADGGAGVAAFPFV